MGEYNCDACGMSTYDSELVMDPFLCWKCVGARKWISVKDQLPEFDKKVLGFSNGNIEICELWYHFDTKIIGWTLCPEPNGHDSFRIRENIKEL